MSKGLSSKERMIEATAALLQRQGYHATGLNQIVREARAPKGSLYFHFPGGKEELALAALSSAGAGMTGELMAIVARHADPAEAVIAVIDYFAEHLESTGFLNGCPMATVALEAAATSDALQQVCSMHYAQWQQQIAAYMAMHRLAPRDASDAATMVLAAFEGGLLLSRAHRDVAPLRAVGRQLARMVRSYIDKGSETPST